VATRRRLHSDLDAITLKALAKQPSRRFRSAEALAEDIHRHLAGLPVQARPPGLGYRAGKFVQRHRWLVSAATAAVTALVFGLAGTTWQAAIARAERDRAATQAQRAEAVQDFLTSLLQSADPWQGGNASWTAAELLERGITRIDEELADQPEIAADLLAVMGGVSRSLGDFERAGSLWRRSLELRRRELGSHDPKVAASLRGVAAAAWKTGHYDEAGSLLIEALAIERAAPDAASDAGRLRLATTLHQLGVLYHTEKRLAEAGAPYREALGLYREILGPDHADVALTTVNLGGLLRDRGLLVEAERLLRQGMATEKRLVGPRHPSVGMSTVSLALTLREMGRLEEAEALCREAIAIDREAYGDDHPSVATKLSNLESVLRALGNYEEAAAISVDVLARDRRDLGPDHPYVGGSLNRLAFNLADLGRFDESRLLLDEARGILVAAHGEDSPAVAANLTGRAVVLRYSGRPSDAVGLLERALAINRQMGDGGKRAASTLAELGAAHAASANLEAAEASLRESLELRREISGSGRHPEAVPVLSGLARVLTASGRGAEAVEMAERALSVARATLPARHWRLTEAELTFAAATAAIGETARAHELAASVLETLATRSGFHAEQLRAEAGALRAR
jgi:serine/threonine-protein kinase